MTPEKKVAPESNNPNTQPHSNSMNAQYERILKALREPDCNGLTTIELWEKYDILRASARIHELRHNFNYNIQTIRTKEAISGGQPRPVARYILLPGKFKEAE